MANMVSTHFVAEWLRQIGYGYDIVAPDAPLPEELRRPLAEAWFNYEHADQGPTTETVEDYMATLDAEGAW